MCEVLATVTNQEAHGSGIAVQCTLGPCYVCDHGRVATSNRQRRGLKRDASVALTQDWATNSGLLILPDPEALRKQALLGTPAVEAMQGSYG